MNPTRCPACGAVGLEPVAVAPGVTVHSCVLYDTRDAARAAPTGELLLGFCRACGLLSNTMFDPSRVDYGAGYEDSQAHSPGWVEWARDIASELVDRYRLHGGRALEIGCGKGDFLALLAETGDMDGVGYDPAYRPGPLVPPVRDRLQFVTRSYTGHEGDHRCDLMVCRHTLEHVPDAAAFVSRLRQGLGGRDDVIVFVEVPDGERILSEQAFWDVYYEHCAYYTSHSLSSLFARCGFDVLRVRRSFGGQYLLMEARPRPTGAPSPPPPPAALGEAVDRYRISVPKRIRLMRRRLLDLPTPVVFWGAGSKAVGLLNALDVDWHVTAVVDVNPVKQGHYLPRSGHPVLAPNEVKAIEPASVVVMNPVYTVEIAEELDRLDVQARVVSL